MGSPVNGSLSRVIELEIKLTKTEPKEISFPVLLYLHMSFCYHTHFLNVTHNYQITIQINHQTVNIIAAWEGKYNEDEIFLNEARMKLLFTNVDMKKIDIKIP